MDKGHAEAFDGRLREEAEDAWGLYRVAQSSAPHLVEPSMPILYFGDSHRYQSSKLRVITVGLNPSREEFPTTDPWRRFPEGSTIDSAGPDLDEYLRSLDRYFRSDRQPYVRWFSTAFGALLRGLDADYFGQARNVALHTDLCSPLATDPTWSRLPLAERRSMREGYGLWHRLVEVLQPHVILMSVAERHLEHVTISTRGEWVTLHIISRQRPYEFRGRRLDTPSGGLLVWGRAAQLPFGSVSNTDKEAAGAAIKAMVG